ncbi:MAG: response regulator [Ferruginibacter sp.]
MSEEKTHVLIIDDNEDILFMLKAMLQFKGYHVSVKENADNVEDSIKELLPDIILMDMLLSGADGREVCTIIKSNPAIAGIPVIMISAMPNAEQTCLAAGADYFLSKPFEMDDMTNTIAAAQSKKKPAP